jgi:DNA polymerase III delta prime subunit
MNKIETNVVKPSISFMENDVENLLINKEWEVRLDDRISEIEKYIRENNGKGKSEEEKDTLYKNAQEMWKEYINILKSTKYNFFLNRTQYKFLTDLILIKIEYDVNTVFFAIELTELLGNMKGTKYTNDKDSMPFEVNATEITYIYHLISKHKVKGLTKDSYTFAQVLHRIGDISKVFNYYDTAGKNLSTDIQNWALTFDEGVTIENLNEETVQSEVL